MVYEIVLNVMKSKWTTIEFEKSIDYASDWIEFNIWARLRK